MLGPKTMLSLLAAPLSHYHYMKVNFLYLSFPYGRILLLLIFPQTQKNSFEQGVGEGTESKGVAGKIMVIV